MELCTHANCRRITCPKNQSQLDDIKEKHILVELKDFKNTKDCRLNNNDEELLETVAKYCDDVLATEAVFNAR